MSSADAKTLTVHERCGVAPSDCGAGNLATQSLPVTFFDIFWLRFHPIQRLLFYRFPCSTTHFLQTIVPNLKKSLSQTLLHYLPIAGNLIYPPDNGMPELRYVTGDSVSLTIAEANEAAFDFNYLTGYSPREADEYYPFVPSLTEPKIEPESGSEIVPLLALQATLFPGIGICMGFTNHHAIGDASSAVRLIKAWSVVSRLGEGENFELLDKKGLIPFLDRSVIKNSNGLRENLWDAFKLRKQQYWASNLPTGKVRGTFVLTKDDIQILKNLVLDKVSEKIHLSSFTVTAAYVWICYLKSAAQNGVIVDDNDPEYFGIPVDARLRMDPPAPFNYFGNCLAFAVAGSTYGELMGEDGFVIAAKLLGDVIRNRVNKKGEILRDADEWLTKFKPLFGKRIVAVAGSPQFDLYEADFGWGTAKKFEAVSIDRDVSMSLCKSEEFEGGLEVGWSLSKSQMEAFEAVFADGLKR